MTRQWSSYVKRWKLWTMTQIWSKIQKNLWTIWDVFNGDESLAKAPCRSNYKGDFWIQWNWWFLYTGPHHMPSAVSAYLKHTFPSPTSSRFQLRSVGAVGICVYFNCLYKWDAQSNLETDFLDNGFQSYLCWLSLRISGLFLCNQNE